MRLHMLHVVGTCIKTGRLFLKKVLLKQIREPISQSIPNLMGSSFALKNNLGLTKIQLSCKLETCFLKIINQTQLISRYLPFLLKQKWDPWINSWHQLGLNSSFNFFFRHDHWCSTCGICKHLGCVTVPARSFVPLCCSQQSQEEGRVDWLKTANCLYGYYVSCLPFKSIVFHPPT